jgi:hypothetical protein
MLQEDECGGGKIISHQSLRDFQRTKREVSKGAIHEPSLWKAAKIYPRAGLADIRMRPSESPNWFTGHHTMLVFSAGRSSSAFVAKESISSPVCNWQQNASFLREPCPWSGSLLGDQPMCAPQQCAMRVI